MELTPTELRVKGAHVFIVGAGAVSPAGWGVPALLQAVERELPIAPLELARPGWNGRSLVIRQVPPPSPRPAFLGQARLRRTSPISQYTVAAALEALGDDAAKVSAGELALGIVVCVMSGCVNYSRRFYDETLRDPATASPLVFPETVFNAPASHLAALLGSRSLNYTLVGDPGTFLQGLALAADWLAEGSVNACLVVAAEENDWLTADAFRLFSKRMVLADGAGAVYLKLGNPSGSLARLDAITDSQLFGPRTPPAEAVRRVVRQLPTGEGTLLVDGQQGVTQIDAPESAAWAGWAGRRVSPKRTLGEGLTAAAAWQCIVASHAVARGQPAANVSVVGTNQQAIGARFVAIH